MLWDILPTCFDVSVVLTISSNGMMCAGLKKWAPIILSAALVLLPISEISIVEVFEDKIVWGPQAFSRSAKICCFIFTFSTAASITCKITDIQQREILECPVLKLFPVSNTMKFWTATRSSAQMGWNCVNCVTCQPFSQGCPLSLLRKGWKSVTTSSLYQCDFWFFQQRLQLDTMRPGNSIDLLMPLQHFTEMLNDAETCLLSRCTGC